MSDAEDKPKTGDRESKDSKDKAKEDGHLDNEVPVKSEDGKDDSGKGKDKVTPSKKNAKAKSQKKEEKNEIKEEEEEEEEEDNDEEEENETNGKVPLLDQPLQISGTRDRKKVQRFSDEFKTVIKEAPKNEIPEGRGVQLGEIAQIESFISKHTSESLKPLYKVLFNRPGKLALVKRNIRKFNGFDFKEGSDEYSKKRASMIKLDMKSLKSISSTLALGSSGTREELVSNILDFLMEPNEKERSKLKESKKKKKVSTSSLPSKKTKRKSNSTAKSKKKVDSDEEDESSDEMEEDENESSGDEKKDSSDEKKESVEKMDSSDEKKESSDEEDEEEDEDSDDKKKKKAPKKKTAANKKTAPKKVEPKKVEATKKPETKTTEKKKRKEEAEAKSDESSEDEPLVKKTKMPPTDEEIKCFVKQILEGANLEEITMKTVCKQVYAAYPEFDLAHKKDFIKTTVKSLIST